MMALNPLTLYTGSVNLNTGWSWKREERFREDHKVMK